MWTTGVIAADEDPIALESFERGRAASICGRFSTECEGSAIVSGTSASRTRAAVQTIKTKGRADDMAFIYWTAASLGLAIAASPGDAALLGRLPEVTALIDRAIEIDEAWQQGALHEFKVVLAGAVPGTPDVAIIRKHYDRAVELSKGKSASAHLAYAEAVSVPLQNAAEFQELMQRALDVNPEDEPANRLVNLLAHRRARWLSTRTDQLIFDAESPVPEGRTSR